MEEKTVKVPGINCGHCEHTIRLEVGELAGVQSVDADHQTKDVTVRWEAPATWQGIEETLVDAGFPPQG